MNEIKTPFQQKTVPCWQPPAPKSLGRGSVSTTDDSTGSISDLRLTESYPTAEWDIGLDIPADDEADIVGSDGTSDDF